ncbi:UNVERIFIED_CONTAM: hypothetical protein Slati_2176900 [Sesamum latifolium]|uniref:Uncharacterized protein n=1 Tax=Sesamum latifolium TaxID=2727402 RepID=A0AAW2WVG2_9LAMI
MPMFAEALGPHALASHRGRPRLACLPPCVSPTISKPADASLVARGIIAPPRHYGAAHAPATPVSCPTITRCILGARLCLGRLLCLA